MTQFSHPFRIGSSGLLVAMLVMATQMVQAQCSSQYAAYNRASQDGKQAILNELSGLGDQGLSCLKTILARTRKQAALEEYEAILDAMARVGTESAANELTKEISAVRRWIPDVPATYLAKMGKTGLPHLVKLSQETEFRFWRGKANPLPSFRLTGAAIAARNAIALIDDREAAPLLGTLLNSDAWHIEPALKALKRIRAPGFEDSAINVFRQQPGNYELRPLALGYLLAVNRGRYLPLIESELQQGVRDEKALIWFLFRMGGDALAVEPLERYIDSKRWIQRPPFHAKQEVVIAILTLGLSRAQTARNTLVNLLDDTTEAEPLHQLEMECLRDYPHWPRILYLGTSDKTKREGVLPISVAAAVALRELGDKSVISALKASGDQQGYLKREFEAVITALEQLPANQAN